MLGHLFFQKGLLSLPLPLEPLSVRSSEVVAGVRGASSSSSLSLLCSRASSGVCSVAPLCPVVLLDDLCDSRDVVAGLRGASSSSSSLLSSRANNDVCSVV